MNWGCRGQHRAGADANADFDRFAGRIVRVDEGGGCSSDCGDGKAGEAGCVGVPPTGRASVEDDQNGGNGLGKSLREVWSSVGSVK